MPGDSSLPDQIVESIAISNAKSIGEQPAILSNLALANQILNNNMQQQLVLSQQQAMNQITMATLAKCVSVITRNDAKDPKESAEAVNLMKMLNDIFDSCKKMAAEMAGEAASETKSSATGGDFGNCGETGPNT